MHGLRRLLAACAALLAVALVPAVVTALWVQVVLLDRDQFVGMSDDILQEDDVRTAVRETIATEMRAAVPELGIGGLQPLLHAALDAALDTATFRAVFAESVASAHRQLIDGEDTIEVRLDDLVALVAEQLRPASSALADAVLEYDSGVAVSLVQREEQPLLWTAFQSVRAGSLVVLAAFVGMIGIALVISPARAATLAFIGFAGGVTAIAVMFLAPRASTPFTDHDPVIGPGVDAAWSVVAGTADPLALGLAVVLGVVCVAGLSLSASR